MPGAWYDPVLIHQVWTNLIGNSIKSFGRKDDPVIEIGGQRDGAE
jgi:light-regulated signal transduction histidine kinase (bacteriophytochrome)